MIGHIGDGVNNEIGICPQGILRKLSTDNIANEPSYETGVLRDIHKKTFHLAPNSGHHEPPEQLSSFDMAGKVTSAGKGISSLGRYVLPDPGAEDWARLVEQDMDTSFDMIYIRCHGRNDDVNRTQLMYHAIQNYEWTVSHTDSRSKYQTKGKAKRDGHVRKLKLRMTKPSFNHK